MTLLTGTLLSPSGTPISGSLYLQLSQDANLISGGGAVAAIPPRIFNLVAGAISGPGAGPYSVPGAAELTPASLTYHLTATGPGGEIVLERDIIITGASVDLGTVVSVTAPSAPLPFSVLGGDATGPAASTTVGSIRNRPLSTLAPTSGQSLNWDGSAWAPLTPAAGPLGTIASDGSVPLTAAWNAGQVITAPGFSGPVTGNASTATTAGTVTTAAQPAITSVGTLSGLTVTAPIAGSVTGDAGLDVKADGTRALTANWNAGNFAITSRNSVGVFNVEAYGAVADGVTDSSAAIQAAINAAAVAGGIVYLPVGHYRARGLRLDAKRAVTIKGSGYGYTAVGSAIGTTIRLNATGAGASRTATVTNGVALVTIAGGVVDADWVGDNIYINDVGGVIRPYVIASLDVGAGTVTLDAVYGGANGAGLATLVEPTILTLMGAQECTVEDITFDGNNLVGSTLFVIDSTNVPQASRMTTANRIALLHGHVGIRVGSSQGGAKQSDSVVLERIYCTEMDSTGIGVWVNSNNVSLLDVRSSVLLGGRYAFLFGYCGPTRISSTYGGGLGTTQTFLSLQGPYDDITLDQCQAEQSSGNFLETTASAAANGGARITLRNALVNEPIDFAVATKVISIGSTYDHAMTLNNHGSTVISIADHFFGAGAITAGATDEVTSINEATGVLTGSVTGNVTGNVSGTAATVTGAAQTAITSVGTLAGLTVTAAPTFSALTSGSVPFAGTAGLLSQDNTNLFWDNTNKWLGIGVVPAYLLHLAKDNYESLTFDRSANANSPTLFSVGISYITPNNEYLRFGHRSGGVGVDDLVILKTGNVGFGMQTPNVRGDFNGAIATRTGTVAVANGLNSNIVTPAFSYVRLTGPTGVFSIGGFTLPSDGRHLVVFNTVAFAMTIVNEDASSTAANRISTLTGANVTLRAGTSACTLIYDITATRWILLSTN